MSRPAPTAARVRAQATFDTLTFLRNGEQTLVSIVLPALALVGGVLAPWPDLGPGRRVDVVVPGVSVMDGQIFAQATEQLKTSMRQQEIRDAQIRDLQRELVACGGHFAVHVGQVGGLVHKRRTDGEEGDLDVFLADDLENLLSKVGLTVIDGESEGVGALAGENKVTSLILLGDRGASGNRGDDLNDGESDGLSGVETLERETNDAR